MGRVALPVAISLSLAATLVAAVPGHEALALDGRVEVASHVPGSAVATGDGLSASGVPSADGRFVVFVSSAGNLVPGQVDANGDLDVFLLERSSGTATLVSHRPGSPATTASGISSFGVPSADGAFVAFASTATDLVAGQSDENDSSDVFVYERATGEVRLVSHAGATMTGTADGFSGSPSISADGRFVAFQSDAPNVAIGQADANRTFDAFVFDRLTGASALVSHTPAGPAVAASAGGGAPSISADGAFVAFHSFSTNLVAGQSDLNDAFDVFLYERASGLVTLVSRTSGGTTTTGDGFSWAPSISGDGDAIAFQSGATNLVAGLADSNAALDAFLFRRSTGVTALVSHTPPGPTTAGDRGAGVPVISNDGSVVAFPSLSTNLVPGQADQNGNVDVFSFAAGTGAVTLASHTPTGPATTGNGPSDAPAVNGDGSSVVFHSHATDLVAGQTDVNEDLDVFRFDAAGGTVALLSHRPGAETTTGSLLSALPRIDGAGSLVAFDSDATDLVAGQADANGTTDVFLWSPDGRRLPPADFDGDGDTDVSVFRPGGGTWFVQGGVTTAWGTSGDIPVPGDYDGDGDTDIAVFRPSTGTWFVQGGVTTAWGTSGDIPVPGDYDGDGDTDIAVFRPSTGTWFVQGGVTTAWGTSGDIPVPGDYDGDGDTDIAVFRPSTGTWFVQGGVTTAWGTSGDVPVPGDYDGDGDTDIAVFRPSSGTWFVQGGVTTAWGTSGDVPVPGDYDGDGDTDIAVFRPSSGTWFVQGGVTTAWGTSGDRPLPLPATLMP